MKVTVVDDSVVDLDVNDDVGGDVREAPENGLDDDVKDIVVGGSADGRVVKL